MAISGDDIRRIRLGLASSEEMLSWSRGEVTNSETINYRSHKPERGGLYAEEIFGPENDYECTCGKYRGKKYEGITCDKCGVLVTDSAVRRVNMGHIRLASPVVHFWYLKGVASPLSRLLGIKRRDLRRIAYYETETSREDLFVVTQSGSPKVRQGETLYGTEVRILATAFTFQVEQAYLITKAPRVVADEGGEVQIEVRKLANGEAFRALVIGRHEYPVTPDAEVFVEDGDTVEAGETLCERPAGELCSQTMFEMLRARYEGVEGTPIQEVVDNLAHLVVRVGENVPLRLGQELSTLEARAYERCFPGGFEATTGAEGIKRLLGALNLDALADELREELDHTVNQGERRRILHRLEVVDQLRQSGNNPGDLVLEVIPVLPPALRPMIQLEGGKFATTDLNDLYRRIINRNNRLKKLREMGAPEIILRNERRMLQEAVDALIHNEKKDNPIRGRDNRPLKSLSERIQGKQGRLRRHLLGRRVDYSGRAVIVVDPELKLHQCGIPKKMALELFKPFILARLENLPYADYDEIKNKALAGGLPEVWDTLDQLIQEYPVLLNRAPTLHRLSIQAFQPVLVDGDAIHIHPHVCPSYNADFDGDQMAVHLPLGKEPVQEAWELMLSARNTLSPAHGRPLALPTQDQVYGFYYLTILDPDGVGKGKAFRSIDEALKAYDHGAVGLHAPIRIRIDGGIVETTLGRAILNQALPPDLRDYGATFDARRVRTVLEQCYLRYGWERNAEVLDELKTLGFRYATLSGLTIAVPDCEIPPEKAALVEEAQAQVERINRMYARGLATEEQRYQAVTRVWRETVDAVEKATMANLSQKPFNPVHAIVASGARGSAGQVKQIAGMRGPMADPQGRVLEWPVISNFREGLSILEYFISTHGGRKGTADTALRTASAGYLTRRLVDACVDAIVKEQDCGTRQGVEIDPLYFAPQGQVMEGIPDRIYGRVTAEPIRDPATGEILVEAGVILDRETAQRVGTLEVSLALDGEGIEDRVGFCKTVGDLYHPETGVLLVRDSEGLSPELLDELRGAGVREVRVRPQIVIRSPALCQTPGGLCQMCYGLDLAFHRLVELGTTVGVIAAQSIGEPGTQLTMRTFHTGGVAGLDITQGLPRAEELFEARKTTKAPHATVAPLSGRITHIETTRSGREVVEITSEPHTVVLPRIFVHVAEGEEVDVAKFRSLCSPIEGRVFLFEEDGERYLAVLDEAGLDRMYIVPPEAEIKVAHRATVEEDEALTTEYHIEAPVAEISGRITLQQESGMRRVIVRGERGETRAYEIPYGSQVLVQDGEEVEAGKKLATRSRPLVLRTDTAGTVLIGPRSVAVVAGKGRAVIAPITPDLLPMVEHGAPVREGQELFQVTLPPGEVVLVDRVETANEVATVRVRYRAQVECAEGTIVRVGDKIDRGEPVSKGVIPPHYLMEVAGVQKTREYLLVELQKVYKSQGVDINDKHFEVVIRQILNNVRIVDPGESTFLLNDVVPLEIFQREVRRLAEENEAIRRGRDDLIGAKLLAPLARGGATVAEAGETITREALDRAIALGVRQARVEIHGEAQTVRLLEYRIPQGERELLRISRAALLRKSWLAAASFERTTKVLADAALRGEDDYLDGLKPCLMVGKRIPVGTGFPGRNAPASPELKP
ncbi:MAG: DNA-directed RNA polymerase subunit beta' [Candidatus Bipolaricaulis sp.]|uniref:DNA-directed RNA polymerase subunit beta' n=1 Tax=Candidatus Bipolaricaulis anaerobius TaxID=2026885 RepID=A0A2X3KJ55_9BACT|nr:DNA-directed RNA polymerase subunit beta' [Candidatus Bipolaricaulis anaerobius]MBP7726471.1 DNA-directed RNA polymerase subunit beta' [Candidatus Bipolaricaulis sp.]SQD92671.1 DNA-directed RNA polymerase subunit beta' [Candidatus Bipolaricaulis anaerobius]